MAICLQNLRLEIKTLENLFSKSHDCFQIVNASVDELTCRFISKNGKKYDIHANITVSRVHIWFFPLFFHSIFPQKKNGSMDLLHFVCVKKKGKKSVKHLQSSIRRKGWWSIGENLWHWTKNIWFWKNLDFLFLVVLVIKTRAKLYRFEAWASMQKKSLKIIIWHIMHNAQKYFIFVHVRTADGNCKMGRQDFFVCVFACGRWLENPEIMQRNVFIVSL